MFLYIKDYYKEDPFTLRLDDECTEKQALAIISMLDFSLLRYVALVSDEADILHEFHIQEKDNDNEE